MEELVTDVQSRLWFTYRRNFGAIGQSGLMSDKGWGCMLRCGQMVLAQALVNYHLGNLKHFPLESKSDFDENIAHTGRDYRFSGDSDEEKLRKYRQILLMFQDKKTATYSIHQMAQMGVSEGKEVGQWFGPNTVAQVLKSVSLTFPCCMLNTC